jgi:hypothetical protein
VWPLHPKLHVTTRPRVRRTSRSADSSHNSDVGSSGGRGSPARSRKYASQPGIPGRILDRSQRRPHSNLRLGAKRCAETGSIFSKTGSFCQSQLLTQSRPFADEGRPSQTGRAQARSPPTHPIHHPYEAPIGGSSLPNKPSGCRCAYHTGRRFLGAVIASLSSGARVRTSDSPRPRCRCSCARHYRPRCC